ncbi:MAG: PHP domain-containing protein, partial [Merismopedia sp. SIO2A8]|nr:PHP domain-containing protein [Merismopedia sp. SIO2A8]
MLELHAHTTYSDGTLSPRDLVKAAAAAGVRALAITDHDTIAGWKEAIATAATLPHPMEIIPGVELSVIEKGRSLHLLGFYPDPTIIQPLLHKQLEGRKRRVQKMVANLADLGYPIKNPEALITENAAPGRPHVAQALVTAGYIDRPQDAFDRWIGEGKPAYVPYEPLSMTNGLELLRASGAITSWAHPYLFRHGNIESMIPAMAAAGLMGLEVYHPTHTPSQQDRLTSLCRQWNLFKTGGSDYHGPAQDQRHPLNYFNLPLGLLH